MLHQEFFYCHFLAAALFEYVSPFSGRQALNSSNSTKHHLLYTDEDLQ